MKDKEEKVDLLARVRQPKVEIIQKFVVWDMPASTDTTPPYPTVEARKKARGFMLTATWTICRDCLSAMRTDGPYPPKFLEAQGWVFDIDPIRQQNGWICPECNARGETNL